MGKWARLAPLRVALEGALGAAFGAALGEMGASGYSDAEVDIATITPDVILPVFTGFEYQLIRRSHGHRDTGIWSKVLLFVHDRALESLK